MIWQFRNIHSDNGHLLIFICNHHVKSQSGLTQRHEKQEQGAPFQFSIPFNWNATFLSVNFTCSWKKHWKSASRCCRYISWELSRKRVHWRVHGLYLLSIISSIARTRVESANDRANRSLGDVLLRRARWIKTITGPGGWKAAGSSPTDPTVKRVHHTVNY